MIIILIFIITSSALANNAQTNFQDGLNYAKSPGIKNTLQKALSDFKPQEALKSKKGEYTENPTQVNYYREDQDNSALEKNSHEEVTKDEEGNAGKVVVAAYTTRPMVKITGKEEFMQKGKLVTDNANTIVMGESNKYINCEANTMATCKIIQVEKTCNEAKPIRKVCEQIPKIDVSTQDVIYPNCKKVVITQDYHVHCPGDYSQFLYSDMVQHVTWDDIRLCKKAANNEENAECLGGYLVRGINGNRSIVQSTERVVVPKNMRSRIRFSHFFDSYMAVTILNETTGQTLHNAGHFHNGQIIELPFSASKDQTFRFYEDYGKTYGGWWGGGHHGKGVMVVYIDHINKIKVASAPIWKELPCRYE